MPVVGALAPFVFLVGDRGEEGSHSDTQALLFLIGRLPDPTDGKKISGMVEGPSHRFRWRSKGEEVEKKHLYGGQAVIEGVMIRGRRFSSVAVRRPNGEIALHCEPLSSFYTGRLRRLPLIRGVVVLAETLILGMRALSYSANVALDQDGKELSKRSLALMMVVSLTLGIGLFFLLPLFATRSLDPYIASSIASNFIEGAMRLTIFVAYLFLIGMLPDIRRVFAYHGAEHMTIHAREEGDPLEVQFIRRYSTAHPRCGTAFLLVVMVVAILVFAFLGRPSLEWRILSRILLIPFIAAISYEIIRFSGAHAQNFLVKWTTAPSLALQALTTRQPDDSQIEIAIAAVKGAVAADEGKVEMVEESDIREEGSATTESAGED